MLVGILSGIARFVKERREQAVFAVLIFLVSLLSFSIGYLTALEELKEPIRIEQLDNGATEQENN